MMEVFVLDCSAFLFAVTNQSECCLIPFVLLGCAHGWFTAVHARPGSQSLALQF